MAGKSLESRTLVQIKAKAKKYGIRLTSKKSGKAKTKSALIRAIRKKKGGK
jgi:hypothetical protein